MTTIEFFYDVGSAYSYLAATQIDALAARTGAAVRWRPFLLGGVFKATGNDMPARVPNKARWMLADTQRWAESYGVDFAMPSRFPLITIPTMRALVAADLRFGEGAQKALALALFRGFWVEDRDVADEAVIAGLAGKAGLDGAAIVAGISAQDTKDALRAATDEAVTRGAFGAPAMFVGEALYWGNDRLGQLEESLRGR
jgi:2-hydroxychromene-2-carboxylate isomerase